MNSTGVFPEAVPDGISVATPGGSVRLKVVGDKIIRVSASPEKLSGERKKLFIKVHAAHAEASAELFNCKVAALHIVFDVFHRFFNQLFVERCDFYLAWRWLDKCAPHASLLKRREAFYLYGEHGVVERFGYMLV